MKHSAYSDPWFIAEQAKAAEKLREVDAFIAERNRRFPVDGYTWGMHHGGGARLWDVGQDEYE